MALEQRAADVGVQRVREEVVEDGDSSIHVVVRRRLGRGANEKVEEPRKRVLRLYKKTVSLDRVGRWAGYWGL